MENEKKILKAIKLPNLSKMSDKEVDAYAKNAWKIITKDVSKSSNQNPKLTTDSTQHKLFEVSLRGSSVVGTSYSQEEFNIAHSKISELRDKGSVKCYPRWCRACTLYRFKLKDDITGHVLKISFPNVVYLTKRIHFKWEFYSPKSEFAKKKKNAEKHFKSLTDNKSNPVFYVRLESEEFVNKCLGGVG